MIYAFMKKILCFILDFLNYFLSLTLRWLLSIDPGTWDANVKLNFYMYKYIDNNISYTILEDGDVTRKN